MREAVIGRILVSLAAVLIATSLVVGVAPVHATLSVYEPGKRVNCGSLFLPGRQAGDDACERRLLARIGWVLLPAAGGLIVGGFGVATIWRSVSLRNNLV